MFLAWVIVKCATSMHAKYVLNIQSMRTPCSGNKIKLDAIIFPKRHFEQSVTTNIHDLAFSELGLNKC